MAKYPVYDVAMPISHLLRIVRKSRYLDRIPSNYNEINKSRRAFGWYGRMLYGRLGVKRFVRLGQYLYRGEYRK